MPWYTVTKYVEMSKFTFVMKTFNFVRYAFWYTKGKQRISIFKFFLTIFIFVRYMPWYTTKNTEYQYSEVGHVIICRPVRFECPN